MLFSVFLLIVLGGFVSAQVTTVPVTGVDSGDTSRLCNMPACEGAYNANKTDSVGCAVYVCPTPTNSTDTYCKDSDNGLNYFTRGETKIVNPSSGIMFNDICLSSVALSEGYCKDNQIATQKYDCPNGCSDGVCIIQMGENSTSPTNDTSGGSGGGSSDPSTNSCLDNPTNYWDQQTNQCHNGFSKEMIAKSCSDPDGGMNKYLVAHTFGFRSYSSADNPGRDLRIRTGGRDACLSNNQLVEHYCDDGGYIQTAYLDCPNGCSDGVCVKGKEINEKVTCMFKDSKSENECYLAGQSKLEDEGTKRCKGTESCIINYTGEVGEKVTWKSTCGGYQYTTQDGNDETITFYCAPGETTSTQIAETHFRNAYWMCADGSEVKEGGESSCKSYSLWKEYALSSCSEKVKVPSTSGVVTSFSLSNVCYSGGEQPSPAKSSTSEVVGASSVDCERYFKECKSGNNGLCNKWDVNCQIKEETNMTISLICKDSCSLDNKCYPFGFRKSDKFCSDSGAFTAQLEADAKCDNNFECGSNVCVSGQCVSEGLIDKMINWFKRVFGG